MSLNINHKTNFYDLKSKMIGDWTLYYYDFYNNVLEDDKGNLKKEIEIKIGPYLNSPFADFRIQIHFEGISLLMGIFYSTKEIRFYSPKLNSELFILHHLNSLDKSSKQEMKENILKLREHVEKVAKLSVESFPSTYQLTTFKHNLSNFLVEEDWKDISADSKILVRELMGYLNDYRPSFFEKISDFALGLTANFALLRIHLLKFLAILPSLDYDQKGTEVKRVLLESFRRLIDDSTKAKMLKKKGDQRALPGLYVILFRLAFIVSSIMPAANLAKLVRTSVRFMAKRFIAGETIEGAEVALKDLARTGRDVTLDQLGELVVSEKEADHYKNEVLKLIKGFSLHVKKGEKNLAGINRAHVSIKVSALCSDFKPESFEYTYKLVAPRLKEILLAAKQDDVFINIDAEHYHYRDLVFEIYKKVLLETDELKDYLATGIVIQAYLRDAYLHLEQVKELAKLRGILMPVRLVKGAYWDAETVEADAHAHDAPQFLNKEETDLHFRQLVVEILKSGNQLQLCLASHNFSDHCFAQSLRRKRYQEAPKIEHQCLHMTYEALSTALAKMNWPVRNYVPVGSLIVGMAYLVRRIMENSSQVGVLTIMRSHKKASSLQTPEQIHKEKIENGILVRDISQSSLSEDFFNITPVRLYLENERQAVKEAFENFELNQQYNNKFILNGQEQIITSTSDDQIVVGKINFAQADDVDSAVKIADEMYNSGQWSQLSWVFRSQCLVIASHHLLARRNELAALICYEAGKSVNEALADVDEAIDFLNFYARSEAHFRDKNDKAYARGTTAVISPWNFPLAIPCGMVCAALVAGNSVILKSAEQTPLIAQVLVDILHESGVPQSVLIHLPGEGETVGAKLVDHERISNIVFTGSKTVGMLIAHKAQRRIYENKLYNQKYPVKVVTEMGGKNAVIVTANAELDETVAGILYSAFGHAGQKCSACSRVLVDNSVKSRLIERLTQAIHDITVGKAFDFETYINPIITKEDQQRLKNQIKECVLEVKNHGGQILVDRSQENLPGNCVGPALFEVLTKRAKNPDSFATRELFGPVVHIIGFNDLHEAVDIFNGTEYALTGGVFSQSQDDIDWLSERLRSGNIYINRTITGARVAIEPFGGFKLSGTGPKAGGKLYIKNFIINPFNEDVVGGLPTPAEEEGSDYLPHLSRASGLKISGRLERMSRVLDSFIKRFEFYYQGIYGEQKHHLIKFNKWVNRDLEEYLTKKHYNRKIPGQLSYDMVNVIHKKVLVVSYEKRPYYPSFIRTLAAICVGSGVTVVCRNQESYQWWSTFKDLLLREGISKKNFDVFFISDETLKKLIKNPKLDSIIIDGKLDKVQKITHLRFDDQFNEKIMTKVLSPYDSFAEGDFKGLTETFVYHRSFAVNTMRHGAPMELDF